MKKLILIFVMLAGAQYFQEDISRYFSKGAFDKDGGATAILFAHQECGQPCSNTKKYLDSRGVEYLEVDPMVNKDIWEEFGSPSKMPYLVVGYDSANRYNPGLLSSVLAMNYGDEYLSFKEQYYYDDHFTEDGQAQIVLYGTSWCGYCKKLRIELEENNIEYVDIDVEKPTKKTKLLKTLGIEGYPTVYVGYKRIRGFDYDAVVSSL